MDYGYNEHGDIVDSIEKKYRDQTTLTESQKKMLTEWLGERWHDFQPCTPNRPSECIKCGRRMYHFPVNGSPPQDRAFATDTDMMDCMRQLVKKGKWLAFSYFSMQQYKATFYFNWKEVAKGEVVKWLMRPTDERGEIHFCRLVAEFRPWEKGE